MDIFDSLSTAPTDVPSLANGINPRPAQVPGQTKRFTFRVDMDQTDDLYSDVSLNRVRQSTAGADGTIYKHPANKITDIQVAAETAIYANLMHAFNGNVRPAIPPAWTDPLTVPADATDFGGYGHAKQEDTNRLKVGWGFDPSSLELMTANFQQVHQKIYTKTQDREGLESAYVKAHKYFKGMGNSTAFDSSIDNSLVRLQEELESREMDRMWGALNFSYSLPIHDLCHMEQDRMRHVIERRFTPEAAADEGTRRYLGELFGEMIQAKASVKFMDQQAKRYGSLRIVMLRANLDAPVLPIYETAFFGEAYPVVLSEIAKVTTAYDLRYAFETTSKAYAADVEPVLVTHSKDIVTNGIRITLPPAPQGYYRGSVVILFRKQTASPPPLPSQPPSKKKTQPVVPRPAPNAFTTDILFTGRVPDQSTFRDNHGNLFEVASKPASFVIYHSGGIAAPEAPPNGYNYGAMVADSTGEMLRWEATYDMAWLESVSGGVAKEKFHSIRNVALHKLAASYLSPGPKGSHERIEVFVEHVAMPKTVIAGLGARRVNLELRGYGPTPFYFFKMPQNQTVMRIFSLSSSTKGRIIAFSSDEGNVLHEVKPLSSAKDIARFKKGAKEAEEAQELEEFYPPVTLESLQPPPTTTDMKQLREAYLVAMQLVNETWIKPNDVYWVRAMNKIMNTMNLRQLRTLDANSLEAIATIIARFTDTLKNYYDAMTRVGNDQYKPGDKLWNTAMNQILASKSVSYLQRQDVDSLGKTAILIRNLRIQLKLAQDKEDKELASYLMDDAKLPEASDIPQLGFESGLEDDNNTEDQETAAAAAETEDEMDSSGPLMPIDGEFSELEQEDDGGEFVGTTATVVAAETEDEMDSTVPANAEFGSDDDGDSGGGGGGGELSEQEVEPFVAETEDEADDDDDVHI